MFPLKRASKVQKLKQVNRQQSSQLITYLLTDTPKTAEASIKKIKKKHLFKRYLSATTSSLTSRLLVKLTHERLRSAMNRTRTPLTAQRPPRSETDPRRR